MNKIFIWPRKSTGQLERVQISEVGVEEEGFIRTGWDYILGRRPSDIEISWKVYDTRNEAIEGAIRHLDS